VLHSVSLPSPSSSYNIHRRPCRQLWDIATRAFSISNIFSAYFGTAQSNSHQVQYPR